MEKNNWEEMYKKEHKLRQEVEGELTIVKTITIDSSPEMRDAKAQILAAENVQKDLRPLSYPTFRLYDDQTHSVLRVSCGGLEPIKRHITEFENYLREHF